MPWFVSLLVSWLPFIALIGVWIFLSRQMQGGAGKAMGFGKSRAKLLTEAHGRVTFEDVAGVDEAKSDLQEIVEFLRDPGKFQRLGGRIPRGVLLVGPPGTGKTLIARAVAGEANVPFFTISGSDFVEMFVGVGASRVRDMFEQAKKNAPCIIFIDEIDAVGRHRGAGLGGGNDEREQTLNQLLVEMDGFEANEGIILIAATNRPDVLDPALLRPGPLRPPGRGAEPGRGRPRADPEGARAQGAAGARREPEDHRARHARLLRRRPRQPRQRSRLMAARRNKRMVTQAEFEDAKDKVMMGAERKSLVMTEEEKMLTAYHEGGHAHRRAQRQGDRSGAQGDHHSARPCARHGHAVAGARQAVDALEQMTSRLAIMMGGRVAEEMMFGKEKVTSGAASDIEQAHQARPHDGDALGPVRGARPGRLRREPGRGVPRLSGRRASRTSRKRPARKIDAEVRRLVEAGHDEATQILDREARRSRNPGQGPARVRDADRRRDQGPDHRQAAECASR